MGKCGCLYRSPAERRRTPTDVATPNPFINRRGGVRKLSNLYASRATPAFCIDDNAGLYYHKANEEEATCEWYIPKYIFDLLGCTFDLDPASPGKHIVPWIPADNHYTSSGLE